MTAPRKLLLTLRGVIHAPIDQVVPLVLHVPRQRDHRVEVDLAQSMITVERGWWYRGETAVTPHADGTLLTYQIFDVAVTRRWAVGLVAGFSVKTAPIGFVEELGRIGARLRCAAYPLHDWE